MNIRHESAVIYLHTFWEDIAETLSVTVSNINAKDLAFGHHKRFPLNVAVGSFMILAFGKESCIVKLHLHLAVQNAFSVVPLGGTIVNSMLLPICYTINLTCLDS